MSHDHQNKPDQDDIQKFGVIGSSPPTTSEECQTGYNKPLYWTPELLLKWEEDYLKGLWADGKGSLSLDIETPPTSPPPPPEPQPSAAPQRISRPLDLRKGGEILLTEEEVQLATSPVPVVVPSIVGPKKASEGSKWPPPLHYSLPTHPKFLGKELTKGTYEVMQGVVEEFQSQPDKLHVVTKWKMQPVTRAEYIEKFHQWEQVYLHYQQTGQLPDSTGTSDESGKDKF